MELFDDVLLHEQSDGDLPQLLVLLVLFVFAVQHNLVQFRLPSSFELGTDNLVLLLI